MIPSLSAYPPNSSVLTVVEDVVVEASASHQGEEQEDRLWLSEVADVYAEWKSASRELYDGYKVAKKNG